MQTFTCHIVDSDESQINTIKQFVDKDAEFVIKKTSITCKDAIKAIRLEKPDLLIIDFKMSSFGDPEITEEVDAYDIPAVIVISKIEQFEHDTPGILTTDYLIKPFDEKRVLFSLKRAKTAIKNKKPESLINRVTDLINQLNEKNKSYLKRISVKKNDKIFFIETEEIDYIETAGNYLKIYFNGKSQLIRESLTNLISQLDPELFYRIHRTTLVNVKKVQEFQSYYHGDYIVIMKNGAKLSMSRNYKDILNKI